MDHVIVTGGAGFIGSHVCKVFAKAGFEPVVYDNFSRGNRAAVQFGPVVEGDIRDADRLADAIRQYKAIGVIHMAALAYVRESDENPLLYYDNNVIGSIRIAQAMRQTGTDYIIFSSTCAVYGLAECMPIDETNLAQPINPYGASKLMAERVLHDADRFGVRSICLRYFNAAGSDPEGQIGEWHEPETHIIPVALMAACGKTAQMTLYGNRHATPDGTTVRDYIHVQDLAHGHLLALRHLLDGGKSDVYNLGTGRGHSITEVFAAIKRVTGLGVPHVLGAANPGDPPILVASGAKARRDFGFSPEFVNLDDMISHTWAWQQKAAEVFGPRSHA